MKPGKLSLLYYCTRELMNSVKVVVLDQKLIKVEHTLLKTCALK